MHESAEVFKNLKDSLNKSQRKAATFKDGTCFVIAGPGSGKTFTVTNRVKWLVRDAGVKEAEILVVTFTKAAAVQMKNRYLGLVDDTYTKVTFSTFHALFFRILANAYGYSKESILEGESKYGLIRGIIKEIRKTKPGFMEGFDENEDFIEDVLSEISIAKNKEIPIEHYYSTSFAEKDFRLIYKAYDATLKAKGLLDFDDMQLYVKDLFTKREDILKKWSDRFKYIMIDEFQDINNIQYEIMSMLGGSNPNIFAVGDDDQSIYAFRGSNPGLCFKFVEDYKGTVTVPLNINYRSTPAIVSISSKLISKNKKRFKKDLVASHKENRPVSLKIYKNEYDEAEAIINDIILKLRSGISPSEIAILFRNNIQSALYIKRLSLAGIKFGSDRKKDAVVLSTIHGSKGLEYEVVYIPQLNENYMPYKKARQISEIEEERRLMYVAMTRAKRYLYLSSAKVIHKKKTPVSLFLKDSGIIKLSDLKGL